MTQLEALRLADMLENNYPLEPEAEEAAAELRRLHEENEQLRQALAQPEQEPVAIVNEGMGGIEWLSKPLPEDTPLYAAPVYAVNTSQKCVDETAKREHEPVGTYEEVMDTMLSLAKGTFEQQQVYTHMKDKPLYTAPPKREWVGLTMQEYVEIENNVAAHYAPNNVPRSVRVFAQVLWETIEAKLKKKNT